MATSLWLPAQLTAQPGDTVTVPVQVDDAAGILSAGLRLQFQTTALDSSDEAVQPGGLWPDTAIREAHVVDESGVDDSGAPVGTLAATVFTAVPLDSGEGTLWTVDFTIPADAERDVCAALTFEDVQLNEGQIPATTSGGTICIPANRPPEMQDQHFSVPENSPQDTIVGTVAATDADSPPQTISYSITAGNQSDIFAIDGQSGQITVQDGRDLDHEDGTNPIVLAVEVADDASPPASTTASVTVDITDENEAPIGITLDSIPVVEKDPGASVGTVTVIDPDSGDSHTLTVSDARFEFDDNQLKLRDEVQLDHDVEPSVSLDITATDTGGLHMTEPFTIPVVAALDPTSRVTGFVYADADGDQVLDPLEGIPNVKLTLEGEGVTATAWTDADGRYEFRDLVPGQYTVTQRHPAAFLAGGPDQQDIQLLADGSTAELDFREGGLKPQYLYSRLFATPYLGQDGSAWKAIINEIVIDAEYDSEQVE